MNKKIISLISIIITLIVVSLFGVYAVFALQDFNGGNASTGQNLGHGSWGPSAVALKISIFTREGNQYGNSKVAINGNNFNGLSHGNGNPYFATTVTKSKISSNIDEIRWYDEHYSTLKNTLPNTFYVSSNVPNTWTGTILQKYLLENDYDKFYQILKDIGFGNLDCSGCYVSVEPMTSIMGYCGTAFELWGQFRNYPNFSYTYGGSIFGNYYDNVKGGIFYNTMYVAKGFTMGENIITPRATDVANNHGNNTRNNCFLDSKCGAGMGVYLLDDIYKNHVDTPSAPSTPSKPTVTTGTIEITKKDGNGSKLNGAKISLYKGKNCGKDGNVNPIKVSQGESVFTVTNLALGDYSYIETSAPNGYQRDNTCYWVNINSDKPNASYSIINNKQPNNYSLIINKLNVNGEKITGKTATFRLYYASNCSTANNYSDRALGSDGTLIISGMSDQVNYSVKEIVPPSGYNADNTCHNISYDGNKTQTLNIVNASPCELDFVKYGSTMSGRIALYQKYPNYNNLLNFNITNPKTACTVNTSCTKTISTGCMSAYSSFINFNENNLSCYSETIKLDGKVGYCDVNFQLSNTYNSTLGSSINFNIYNNYEKFESGQMVINKDFRNRLISTGVITKHCYVYPSFNLNTETYSSIKNSSLVSDEEKAGYTNYVNSYTLNNRKIDPNTSSSDWDVTKKSVTNGSEYYELTKTYTATYNAQAVYTENGTGAIHYSKCENCELLGYGYASPLNATGKMSIPFKININEQALKGKIQANSGNTCTYEASKKITTTTDELNLLYRTIDTSNAFPGRLAKGRTVGWNWQSTSFDFNNDKVLNQKDLDILKKAIEGSYYYNILLDEIYPECDFSSYKNSDILYGDLNGDKNVTTKDRIELSRYLSGSVTLGCKEIKSADINNDGIINSDDYNLLAKSLADKDYEIFENKIILYDEKWDINKDGLVDDNDYNYAKWVIDNYENQNYNNTKSDNPLIKYVMETTNNSKNKDKKSAKYKILLTQKDIKNIRKYNASTKYNDYTLTCTDENNCKSTFLENLKNGKLYKVDGNFIGNVSILEVN